MTRSPMVVSSVVKSAAVAGQKPDDLPEIVRKSHLWQRLSGKQEYATTLLKIRQTAAALAQLIPNALPAYTDHSVRHMDSLWRICDEVLTEEEFGLFTASEAFLLAASFYIHDLGMATPVTEAGKQEIRKTLEYKAAHARFTRIYPKDQSRAERAAMSEATRELHAKQSRALATERIVGLDRFLIEDTDFRDRWGHILGETAESHNWTLEQVEQLLGARKVLPGPDGDTIDISYMACILRIVDYGHMDRLRALKLDRELRSDIPLDSALHWDAQTNITGPIRDGDFLVFGYTKPIESIDAWWLFFDMASGFDAEIRGVHEYLRNRTASAQRFSLKGVKGVEDPASFNNYVSLPADVVPIDIRVQPESMERVVDLLGGRHIYGPDEIAPVRELIQNARDAIELRNALERAQGHPVTPGKITISLQREGELSVLSVSDNGVGMTRSVVRRHLVGVGSDFWNSAEFHREYQQALEFGFHPIGKFGIGFLSVFMLGDTVDVDTEAAGNSRLHLTLHGVGRRGELRECAFTGAVGTEIQVALKPHYAALLENLVSVVQARAPMLSIPIVVELRKGKTVESTTIEPKWWQSATEEALMSFIRSWQVIAYHGSLEAGQAGLRGEDELWAWNRYHYFNSGEMSDVGKWSLKGWPGERPRCMDNSMRLLSSGGEPFFGIVRCSQGIAVDSHLTPDITGIAELGEADLTVSRESFGGAEVPFRTHRMMDSAFNEKVIEALRPDVIRKLNDVYKHGMLPGRLEFLRAMMGVFGRQVFDQTTLEWIPVTEPPGNLIHRSKLDFVKMLRQHERVLLAVGVTPSGAYAVAAPHVSELSKIPVVAVRKEEVEVSYDLKNKLEHEGLTGTLIGSLQHILSLLSHEKATLLITGFLLECIAQAWGVSVEMLEEQQWRLEYKDNVLWSDLSRLRFAAVGKA